MKRKASPPQRTDPAAADRRPPAASGEDRQRSASVGFLLSQVGAHAAACFAERLAPLDLTPAHAGILRLISREPDLNQRALARRLQALPSRVVAFIDELEDRGLVARQRREDDRRSHVLRLTALGHEALAALREVAEAHDADIARGLSAEERRVLTALLLRIIETQDLSHGVHPGYRAPPRGARDDEPDLPAGSSATASATD